MQLKNTFIGHTNAITSLAFASKSAYLASGGRDGNIIMWNVTEGKFIKSKQHTHPINGISFCPSKYLIAAATDDSILIWDPIKEETYSKIQVAVGEEDEEEDAEEEKAEGEEKKVKKDKKLLQCLSVIWSSNGKFLYTGWSDNVIRVYEDSTQ